MSTLSKQELKKFHGDEPVLDENSTTGDFINAHTYYNYVDDKRVRGYALSYLESIGYDKKKIASAEKIPVPFMQSIGTNFRLLATGSVLSQDVIDKNFERLEKLIEKYGKKTKKSVAPNEPTVQDRTMEKVGSLIADIEDEIDKFWDKGSSDFNVAIWLTNNEVKPKLSTKIAEYYWPLYEEALEILKGTDDQLNEAYSKVKRMKKKRYAEFLKNIIYACETRLDVQKASRKTRKTKEKPVKDIVANVKYLPAAPEFGIKSVNPTKLVGASQVWVFNTKYRQLGVYNALGPNGITVKGTTLQGFDEKTSTGKTLRKPEEVLPKVLSGGRVARRNLIPSIRAVEKKMTGRINKDTVIMRVING